MAPGERLEPWQIRRSNVYGVAASLALHGYRHLSDDHVKDDPALICARLEHHLASFTGAVVAVTHDRYFLDNVAKWILELDYGRGYPYEGNYSGWLEQKKKRLAVQEKQESARQKQLDRELEWAKSSPRAQANRSS